MRPIAKQNQYFGDAEIEASYLSSLMSDSGCPASIVKFFGSVRLPDPLNSQRQFHALIFEECGASLHAFWQDYAKRHAWHSDDICSIAFQVLQCCAFLHGKRFVHTDLKHKNIMLKSAEVRDDGLRPKSCSIKVIDFGNMTHEDDYHTQPIGTRQFRAPEIQLALDWDVKFDLWGSACVFHWMHESRTVFEPKSETDQLYLMETLVGRELPEKLIKRSKKQHFFHNGKLKARNAGTLHSKVVPIPVGVKDAGFKHLLLDLFELDPMDRLPAVALLEKHAAFFEGPFQVHSSSA